MIVALGGRAAVCSALLERRRSKGRIWYAASASNTNGSTKRERENRMALELNVVKCYKFGMFSPLSTSLYAKDRVRH